MILESGGDSVICILYDCHVNGSPVTNYQSFKQQLAPGTFVVLRGRVRTLDSHYCVASEELVHFEPAR
jgi:hypothetical protein